MDKYNAEYRRNRRRIQQFIRRGEKRGYTFNYSLPETPKNITKKDLDKLKGITPDKLYSKAKYQTNSGNIVSGEKGRYIEQVNAAKKSVTTRLINEFTRETKTYFDPNSKGGITRKDYQEKAHKLSKRIGGYDVAKIIANTRGEKLGDGALKHIGKEIENDTFNPSPKADIQADTNSGSDKGYSSYNADDYSDKYDFTEPEEDDTDEEENTTSTDDFSKDIADIPLDQIDPQTEADKVIDNVLDWLKDLVGSSINEDPVEFVKNILETYETDPLWSESLAAAKQNDRDNLYRILRGAIKADPDGVARRLQENSTEVANLLANILYGSGDKEGNFKDGRTQVNADIARFAKILYGRELTVMESAYVAEIQEMYEDTDEV